MKCAAAGPAVLLLLAVAAPLAAAQGGAPAAQHYRATTHACSPLAAPGLRGPAAALRTCVFRNLYLYNGRAYYLSDGPAPDFTKLGLYMHMWTGLARLEPPWFFKGGYSPGLFASQLARGTAVPPLERLPLAYLWRGFEVVTDVGSNATCDGRSKVPGASNYYHFVGEYLPLLTATLCEEFCHCQTYSNRSALQIIDVAPPAGHPCNVQELYPQFYREGLACLSDKPLRHLAGSFLKGRLTLVETAWVGLSARCRGMQPFDCYAPQGSLAQISSAQMAAWRSTAEQCFGFQGTTAASLRPVRLLLVDRLYESGRSILNVASVLRELRRRFSPQQVELRLEYMEGLTIRVQAEIFSWASVVVHMHGAAMGNYAFLPEGAVTVHMSPIPRRWPPVLAFQWAQDLRQVTDIEVRHFVNEDWSRVQLVPDIVEQQAARRQGVAQLMRNKTFYAEYRGTFQCPEWLGALYFPCRQYMTRALTASLPPGKVADLAEDAVARLFLKQGQKWEPQRAEPGASTQSGGADRAAGLLMVQQQGLSSLSREGSINTAQGPLELLRHPVALPSGTVSWVLMALGAAMLATWLLLRQPQPKMQGGVPLHSGSKPP
ncbi:hypothetical protein ABPG77_009245 [Micractinium sp. CCAP 211/92]